MAPEFDDILLKAVESRVGTQRWPLISPATRVSSAGGGQACGLCVQLGGGGRARCRLAACWSRMNHSRPTSFIPRCSSLIEWRGSQRHVLGDAAHLTQPPAYAWSRRLESFVPGLPGKCGDALRAGGRIPLAPCKQRISDDGRLRYLGGRVCRCTGAGGTGLMRWRRKRAWPRCRRRVGYVGVDLVLGPNRMDGSDDVGH